MMFINVLTKRHLFSLYRSKKIFYHLKEQLLNKAGRLSTATYETLKQILMDLEQAIHEKQHEKAYELRQMALLSFKEHLKKNTWDYIQEYLFGIGGILLLVILVNQMWFQNYQIPSGSMRPTLMEKDRLVASKTSFGLNFPFKKGHFYFNPERLQRGNLVILENDRLPKEENQSRYLFLFPVKKQFVKRLIGKPGDTLYFYGGKIYGLDRQGHEIKDFHDSQAFEPLEHIPFNTFEGKVLTEKATTSQSIYSPAYLYQMDQLIGKLSLQSNGSLVGKFYNGSQWRDETPLLSYKNLWGIKNYAMARLVTKEQALASKEDLLPSSSGYYIELHHSPSLTFPRPTIGLDLEGRVRPKVHLEKSYLPLNQKHLERIANALSTCRFVVKEGYAGNYSLDHPFKPSRFSPYLEHLPDGTYEIIQGKCYQIDALGRQIPLSASHPLNLSNLDNLKLFFNMGVHLLTLFDSEMTQHDFLPARYAYFRNKGFYLFSKEIFDPSDPLLIDFIAKESQKNNAFVDHGPPLHADGKLNKEFVMNYGLTIPKGHYLCLGDNHAGSRDCREWGFIPQKNIQGSPSLIFWPPSKRMGRLIQNQLSSLNPATWIVSLIGLSFILAPFYLSYKRRKKEWL